MPNELNKVLNGLYQGGTALYSGYLEKLNRDRAEDITSQAMNRLQMNYAKTLAQNERLLGIHRDVEGDAQSAMRQDYLKAISGLSGNPYKDEVSRERAGYYRTLQPQQVQYVASPPLQNRSATSDSMAGEGIGIGGYAPGGMAGEAIGIRGYAPDGMAGEAIGIRPDAPGGVAGGYAGVYNDKPKGNQVAQTGTKPKEKKKKKKKNKSNEKDVLMATHTTRSNIDSMTPQYLTDEYDESLALDNERRRKEEAQKQKKKTKQSGYTLRLNPDYSISGVTPDGREVNLTESFKKEREKNEPNLSWADLKLMDQADLDKEIEKQREEKEKKEKNFSLFKYNPGETPQQPKIDPGYNTPPPKESLVPMTEPTPIEVPEFKDMTLAEKLGTAVFSTISLFNWKNIGDSPEDYMKAGYRLMKGTENAVIPSAKLLGKGIKEIADITSSDPTVSIPTLAQYFTGNKKFSTPVADIVEGGFGVLSTPFTAADQTLRQTYGNEVADLVAAPFTVPVMIVDEVFDTLPDDIKHNQSAIDFKRLFNVGLQIYIGGKMMPGGKTLAREYIEKLPINERTRVVEVLKAADENFVKEILPKDEVAAPKRVLTGNEFGAYTDQNNLRTKVKNYLSQFVGETFTNKETNFEIKVTKAGIKKTTSSRGDIHLKALHDLPEIIKQMKYVIKEVDDYARPDVEAIHIFTIDTIIDGKDYIGKITVRQTVDGKFFYDQYVEEK